MNYIDNEELLKEILTLKEKEKEVQKLIESGMTEIEARKQIKPVSDKLGEMILKIARRYATRPNFSGYTWKEDMISDAVFTCCKYLKNFNEEKSNNCFWYVTKIVYNSFCQYIKKQKKHSEIKDICYNERDRLEENFFTCVGINYQKLVDK